MKIAIVSARYMDQNALESFFGQVFGYGQARVTVSAGEFTRVQMTDFSGSGPEANSSACYHVH
jgi:hypothetical protein